MSDDAKKRAEGKLNELVDDAFDALKAAMSGKGTRGRNVTARLKAALYVIDVVLERQGGELPAGAGGDANKAKVDPREAWAEVQRRVKAKAGGT